ncbi:MAG: hypothetical protein QXV17_07360 [Candidatus Micrarchaeaceae archaeon]
MENEKYIGMDELKRTKENVVDSLRGLIRHSELLRVYLSDVLLEIITRKEKPIVYEVEDNVYLDYADSGKFFSFKWSEVERIDYFYNGLRKRIFR